MPPTSVKNAAELLKVVVTFTTIKDAILIKGIFLTFILNLNIYKINLGPLHVRYAQRATTGGTSLFNTCKHVIKGL